MTELVSPLAGQVTGFVADLAGNSETGNPGPIEHVVPTGIDAANVMTSQVAGRPEAHKIVLDIDLPCRLIPSSTPEHYHLIIDTEMSWNSYHTLLTILGVLGVLEPGYVSASIERGYTCVRLPWIKKGDTNGTTS